MTQQKNEEADPLRQEDHLPTGSQFSSLMRTELTSGAYFIFIKADGNYATKQIQLIK